MLRARVKADVLILDPATVADRAEYDEPHHGASRPRPGGTLGDTVNHFSDCKAGCSQDWRNLPTSGTSEASSVSNGSAPNDTRRITKLMPNWFGLVSLRRLSRGSRSICAKTVATIAPDTTKTNRIATSMYSLPSNG